MELKLFRPTIAVDNLTLVHGQGEVTFSGPLKYKAGAVAGAGISILIGQRVKIDDKASINIRVSDNVFVSLTIEDDVVVSGTTVLDLTSKPFAPPAEIKIGKRSTIAGINSLKGNLLMGDDSAVQMLDTFGDLLIGNATKITGPLTASTGVVLIGDNVEIDSNVYLGDGVVVGSNNIVPPNCGVPRSLPPLPQKMQVDSSLVDLLDNIATM